MDSRIWDWPAAIGLGACLVLLGGGCKKSNSAVVKGLVDSVQDGTLNPSEVDIQVAWWRVVPHLRWKTAWVVDLHGQDGGAILLEPPAGVIGPTSRRVHLESDQLKELLRTMQDLAANPSLKGSEEPLADVLHVAIYVPGHRSRGYFAGLYPVPLISAADRLRGLTERAVSASPPMEADEEVSFLARCFIWGGDPAPAWRMVQIKTDASTQVLKKWDWLHTWGVANGSDSVADSIFQELKAREGRASPKASERK